MAPSLSAQPGPPAKICMLTSVHAPFDTRIFAKEARTLAAAGYDVTLVAPHSQDETRDQVAILGVRRVEGRGRRLVATVPRVLRRALASRAHVYHFHDPELIPCGLLLKLLGKWVIYDAHEDVPRDLLGRPGLPSWSRHALARVLDLCERTAARTFDAVVAARDDIAPRFQPSCRTVTVNNYPDLRLFRDLDPSTRRSGPLKLMYVGLMSEDRGLAEVVAALELLERDTDVEFHLYGTFSPREFEARLRAMPGFRRVRYGGWVEHRNIPAILASADIGVVCFLPDPNNVNAGPTKLFEYLAAGLPVIGSDFPRWREVLEGNRCGVCVDPRDPAAIAAAVRELSRSAERRRQMGTLARKAAFERYNWDTQAIALLSLYRSLTHKMPSAFRA